MNRRAFTLLEVLIALVLIAAVASSLFAFLGGLTSRAQRVGEAMDRSTGLEVLFERLEAGLAGSYAVGATGEAGVAGDATKVVVRGHGVSFASHGGRTGVGDAIGSELAYDAASGRLTGRALGMQPGGVETLAEGIARVRFRYHDGTAWRDTFDSVSAGRLPAAVEVSVWFGEPQAPDESGEAPPPTTGPVRSPDRRRVITVPDAPGTTWKEGA